MSTPVKQLTAVVVRTFEILAMSLMLALVVVVSGSVVLRSIGRAYTGADELARILFVWLAFIGAFLALREGAHLAMTTLSRRLSERPLVVLLVIVDGLVLMFLGLVAWHGTDYAIGSAAGGRVTPGLGVSTLWGHAALPVGATLMAAVTLSSLVAKVVALAKGRPLGAFTDPPPEEEQVP